MEAYRRGDVETALERFEEAYDLTELPMILYNIGLTYMRLYEASNDVGQLRRAKVVLNNFKLELAADTSLGDMDEIDKLLDEIDEKIASHQADAPTGDARAEVEEDPTQMEGPEVEDTPSVRGMIDKVSHLVVVLES